MARPWLQGVPVSSSLNFHYGLQIALGRVAGIRRTKARITDLRPTPDTRVKARLQHMVPAICVNPSETYRRSSEPRARRADGAARPIAERIAGTRADPPVRKIVS